MNKLQQGISSGLGKLADQPTFKAGIDWYKGQTGRDQLIIRGLGAFIAVCLFVVLIVQPMFATQDKYEKKLDKSLAIYQKLASNAHKFSSGVAATNSGTPVMGLTTRLAKQYNLNLKRFEPDNDDLRIWLENVAFDSAIAFIEELNKKHGGIVKQINAERTDQSGRVNLRATLGR